MLPTATSQRIDDRVVELHRRNLALPEGSVAQFYASGRGYYPPDRAGAERDHFGIAAIDYEGGRHEAGDHTMPFALQSISKVFAYGLALEDCGAEQVLKRVGVEPSGDAFNSIVFDKHHTRPHNPMVNAGALVATDLVDGRGPDDKVERILDLLRKFAGNPELEVDEEIFEREMETADRNRATAYLMRSQGMLAGEVEDMLTAYLRPCSVTVTCDDLAVMAATLANGCVNPVTGKRALSSARTREILSVMYTCGMYDFAGQWAFEVGVPAKSGVSGGILAVVPGKLGLGVFSPGLDPFGNSVRGTRVCEAVSTRDGLHLFASEAEDAMLGAAPAAAEPAPS